MRLGSFTGLLLAVIAFASNCIIPTIVEASSEGGRADGEVATYSGLVQEVDSPKATVTYLWMAAHIYFAIAMFLTFMVNSRVSGMILIASVGVSWAATLWVPYCLLGVAIRRQQRFEQDDDGLGDPDSPQAGAIMGFHNACISAPQIFSALACSIIFALLSGTENSAVWALRLGGCWTVVAAYLSWKLSSEIESL